MSLRDVHAPGAATGNTTFERASPLTSGDEVTITAPDGSGGPTPLTVTALTGSGGHVGVGTYAIPGGPAPSLPSGAATEVTLAGLRTANHTDLAALLTALGLVVTDSHFQSFASANHVDLSAIATQATVAAILAKLTSDPATQTTLAAILAKQPTTPALEGGNLASILSGQTSGTQTAILRGGAVGSTAAQTVTAHDTSQANIRPIDTEETLAPVYEDNTNGVAAVMQRDVLSSTYTRSELGVGFASNAFNLRAAAGQVNSIQLVNRNASQRIFGLVNKASAPVNGDTIARHIIVQGNTTLYLASDMLGTSGVYLGVGVSGAWSTTSGTVTLATAADHDAVVWGV